MRSSKLHGAEGVSGYMQLFMCFISVQCAVCVCMEQFCTVLFVVLGVCLGSS